MAHIEDLRGNVVQRTPPDGFTGEWPFSYMEYGDNLVMPYGTAEETRAYRRARAAAQAYSERTGVRVSFAKKGIGDRQVRYISRGRKTSTTPEETRQKLLDLPIYAADGTLRGTQGMAATGLLHLTPWPFKFFEVGDYVEFDLSVSSGCPDDTGLARKARAYAYTYGAGMKRAFKSRLRCGVMRIWRES